MKLNHKLAKRFLAVALSFAMVVTSLFVMPTASEAAAKATIGNYKSVKAGNTVSVKLRKLSKNQYAKVSVTGTAKDGITITKAGKKITANTKIQGTGSAITLKVKNYGVPGKNYVLTVKTYNKSTNELVGTYKTAGTYIYKKTTAMDIVEADQTLNVGETFDFTGKKTASNSTEKIKWTSSNEAVATVGKTGLVTAVATGEATITATSGNFSDSVKVTVPGVTGVTATTEGILTVTGFGLADLTKADITLPAGYEVAEVTPAADGTSAVVKVSPAFTADVDYTVSVKGTEFTLKVATTNESVTTKTTTFDSATEDQYMTVNVNGKEYAANSEWLNTEGYTINFTQVAKSVSTASDLFAGDTTASSTGLINSEIMYDTTNTWAVSGDQSVVYTVDVVVMRDGGLVSTGKVEVTVEDTDYTVSALTSDSWTLSTTGSAYVMNSSTLIVGETATLTSLVGTYRGVANTALLRHAATLTSSNTDVIDISSTNTILAVGAGTATVTIEVGGATRTHTFTVKANEVRTLNKVTPSLPNGLTTLKLHDTAAYAFAVVYTDQFGDYIDAAYDTDFFAYIPVTKDTSADIVTLASVTNVGYAEYLTATATDLIGNGTLRFYNITNGKELTLGSMTVYTTNVDKVNNVIKVEESADESGYNVASYDASGYFYQYETVDARYIDSTGAVVTASGSDLAANTYFFDASLSALKDYGITATKTAGLVGEDVIALVGGGTKEASSIKVPLYKVTDAYTAGSYATEGNLTGVAFQDYAVTSNVGSAYPTVTSVQFNTVATIDYIDTNIDFIYEALDVRETDIPGAGTCPVVYGLTTSIKNDNYLVLVPATDAVGGYDIVSVESTNYDETDLTTPAPMSRVVGRVVLEKTSGTSTLTVTDGRTFDTAAGDNATLVVRVIGPDASGVYTDSAYTVAVKAYKVNVK